MFEDIIKSIKLQMAERLASPLLGAFAIAWSILNFKFYVVVFSSESVSAKFVLIDEVLSTSAFTEWWQFVLFHWFFSPIAYALIYIFAFPLVSEPIYKYHRERQKRLAEIRQKIDDETPLTKEQSREIRNSLSDLRSEYEKELDQKNAVIEGLKKLVAELQTARATGSANVKIGAHGNVVDGKAQEQKTSLTSSQKELISKLSEAGGKIAYNTLIQALPGAFVTKLQYEIDELEHQGLVTTIEDLLAGKSIGLTLKGRKIAIDIDKL